MLLWVVLGVVLAVVAAGAVTLLVVAPWDDDSSSADAGRDEDNAAEEEPPADPPADPPVASDRVTGDRDGDGLGDAQFGLSANYGETFERWTFTSTGSGFESVAEPEDALDVYGQAFADWDGDGEPGALSMQQPVDNGDSISFTLVGDETGELDVKLPSHGERKFVTAVAGDFDGDGRQDIAVSTGTAACEVTVSVLLGTGSGFGDPTPWAVLAETLTLDTRLAPADADGDGDTDLVGVVPGEAPDADQCDSGFWIGGYAGIVLTSTGTAFEPGAKGEVDVDELKDIVGGDFSGAGTPMLAVADYGTTIRLLEHDGSGLVDLPDRTVDLGPALEAAATGSDGTTDFGIEALNVADVDGDGDDDLVVLAHDERADLFYAGVWVLRSDGAGFGEPEKWAEASDCGEFDSCSGDAVTGTVFN